MPDGAFVFRGVVFDDGTGRPASGIDVMLVDDPIGAPAVMLGAATDATGAFAVALGLAELTQLFRRPGAGVSVERRRPTLHAIALRGGVAEARASVEVTLAQLASGRSLVTLHLGAEGRGDACVYLVRGRVVETDGTPRAGVRVEVLSRRLRSATVVATAVTDRSGAFVARHRTATPCDPARPGLTLVVRAQASDGTVLATSRPWCDAPAELDVTLVVGDAPLRGPAAIDELDASLREHLDGVPLSELTTDEVEQLACTTRRAASAIAWLARSAALAERTGVPRSVYFALAEAGVPLTEAAVAGLPRAALQGVLERAAADNLVPPWPPGELDAIADRLAAQALDLSYAPTRPRDSVLGRLFEHAGVSTALPRSFVEGYLARTGTVAEFWQAFRRDHGNAAVDTIAFTLGAAAMVGGLEPVVSALQAERAAGRIPMLRHAARLQATDWSALLLRVGVPVPASLPGADDDARRELYAAALERAFEYAYPTDVTAQVFATEGGQPELAAFVEQHPEFDLGSTHVETFLAGGPRLPPEAAADLPRTLRLAQRLHAVLPTLGRRGPLAAMLRAGFTSASQIHRLGPGALARRMPSVSADQIAQIHRRAGQVSSKAMATFFKFGSVAQAALPAAMAPVIPDQLPSVVSLLGRMDFCACTSCRSVFSPAAYLTDLLRFCDDQGLLDALLERRPDLATVMLGCHNTNTVLPTIDLTIELLEDVVSPPPTRHAYQTTWSAEDLRAHPEHVHAPAYAVLRNANFPWALPFDLSLLEARTYLEHMGTSLFELRDALSAGGDAGRRTRTLARLGLSETQASLVDGSFAFDDDGDAWGLSQANWVERLGDSVREVMQRGALEFDDILDLGRTRFAGGFEVVFPDDAPCDVDRARFVGLTQSRLLRIARFERLRRVLGLSIPACDALVRALGSVGANPLDVACLDRIAVDRGLASRFPQVDERSRMGWWADLDTHRGRHGEPSYYDELFLDRTVTPDNVVLELDASGHELANVVGIRDEHRTALQAAASITEGELDALLAAISPAELRPRVDLRLLSRFHRRVTLARALRTTVDDLLAFAGLSGLLPFDDGDEGIGDPNVTVAFVSAFDTLRDAGWTVAELDALLRGTATADSTLLDERPIATQLIGIIRGLQQIRSERARAAAGAAAEREQLVAALPRVVDPQALGDTVAWIAAAPGSEPSDVVREQLAGFAAGDVIDNLASPTDPRDSDARVGAVLDVLLAHLRRVESEDLIVHAVADFTALPSSIALLLLQSARVNDGPALAAFVDDAFLDAIDFERDGAAIASFGFPQATWPSVAPQAAMLRNVHAASVIIGKLQLGLAECEALVERGAARGWLDLLDVAQTPGDGASPRFAQLLELSGIAAECRRSYQAPTAAFVAILDAADRPLDATLDALSQAAPWPREELAAVAEALAFTVDELRVPGRLAGLGRALRLVTRVGVVAGRLLAWAGAEPDVSIAQEIKGAARARIDAAAWSTVAGPLRDGLRRAQRDALVARSLVVLDLGDADMLSERLLIDVAGEPCQRTSRIRSAIAAVQTFVQRVTLARETDLELPADAVQQWSWMSRYRVWEANRRVLLYPENYLDPRLRRDATPQFRVLADEVASSDGDPAQLEAAYRHYLDALDDVGHLSVCGLVRDRQVLPGEVIRDDLHVIGRRDGTPHRFYYRRRAYDGSWTPWEEIPGRIDGRDATPVVWNRRLFLLWLQLREGAREVTPVDDGAARAPDKLVEARLGWMERRHGEWTPPTLSEPSMVLPPEPVDAATAAEFFDAVQAADVGFDVGLASSSIHVLPIVRVTAFQGDRAHAQSLYMTKHAFYLYGDGRVGIDHRTARRIARALGPRAAMPAEPIGQGFTLRAGRHLSVPTSHPSVPGAVKVVPLLTTEFEGEIVAQRTSFNIPSQRKFADGPFAFQDRQRVVLVERPRPRPSDNPAQTLDAPDVEALAAFELGNFVPPQRLSAGGDSAPGGEQAGPELPSESITETQLVVGLPTLLGDAFELTRFDHPYSRWLITMLEERGIDGFFAPPMRGRWSRFRRQAVRHVAFDADHYRAPANVDVSGTIERIDFDHDAPLSAYNWELFFHGPMMVAAQLLASGRPEEARRWIHAVFDPQETSDDPAPARYWRLRPFFEASTPAGIVDELELLSYDGPDPVRRRRRRALEQQIERWRANPFEPHVIAQLRPAAYQRWCVMRYLDVLIGWGDMLFRQGTSESASEAMQIYMLAARLLGPKPVPIEREAAEERSYAQLAAVLDDFGNAIVELENLSPGPMVAFGLEPRATTAAIDTDAAQGRIGRAIPWRDGSDAVELEVAGDVALAGGAAAAFGGSFLTTDPPMPNAGPSLYFCVPPNDKMLGYWDTVADRLFKLRNCLDIDGARRDLALFEPPIDPMLLVRARAMGVDIASAVSALSAPLPHHRFRTMIGLAKELCADVRTLGTAIGQAFERRDAESLAELRAGQERDVLRAVRRVRERQLEEARANREALLAGRAIARQRLNFVTSRETRSAGERRQSTLLTESQYKMDNALQHEQIAAAMSQLPNLQWGNSGPFPVVTFTFGGANFASIAAASARGEQGKAQRRQGEASIVGIQASLRRRDEEWLQETALAQKEVERIDRELAASDIRIAIAQNELDNHERQVRNAEDVDEFLRSRFSNAELYGQMASELGRVFFAAYQLAYDLAKQAERTYQYELAAPDASFVEFGYWDNTRRGLLAGDKLMYDLRRMEVAYTHFDRRELEIVKQVSLALLDPVALTQLRETGECAFEVPEALFDLDHPGHYLRRIRSVSVTLPVVEGAYGNVSGTLFLLGSSIRRAPTLDDVPVEDPNTEMQQIALSTGLDDAGVFDRGGDDRRLPFEGRGAVSRWRLRLPGALRQFDYRDISDVVLRVAYTARDGGEPLRDAVSARLEEALLSMQQSFGVGLVRQLSLRTHFPEAWSQFIASSGDSRTLAVDVADVHFPLRLREGAIGIRRAWLVATFSNEPGALALDVTMPGDAGAMLEAQVQVTTPVGPRVRSGVALARANDSAPMATTGRWQVSLPLAALPDAEPLVDLALLLEYVVTP